MGWNPFRKREVRTDYPTNSLRELYDRREAPLSTAGVSVDVDTAMRLGAVWSCVDLIASQLSTLPLDEYRNEGNSRVELPTPTLLEQPDGELELDKWLYQVLESVLKRGNAFGLILSRDREGWPTKIKMLHPSLVQIQYRGRIGIAPVEFTLEGTPIAKFDPKSGHGDLWHFPGYMVSGTPIGLSPIGYHAMSIGVGLAAQQFGANWFRDGGMPGGLLTHDGDVGPDVAKIAKHRWMEATSGNREPIVMGGSWKYEQVQIAPEESQFLDTMKYTKADVAGIYRIRPEKIGGQSGNSMTYANIESANIDFLVQTLQPWMVSLEKAISALRPRPRYVKFNPDALLRTDSLTRAKVMDMLVRGGQRSVDEVRALDQMPELPDGAGKRYLWPPLRQQLTNEELQYGADNEEEEVSVDTKIAEEQAGAGAGDSGNEDQLALQLNGNGQGV